MGKMVIGMPNGTLEKLLCCSIAAGGGVALDLDVDIYLLLMGAYAFKKDVVENKGYLCEQPTLKEQMLAGCAENKVAMPFDSYGH